MRAGPCPDMDTVQRRSEPEGSFPLFDPHTQMPGRRARRDGSRKERKEAMN